MFPGFHFDVAHAFDVLGVLPLQDCSSGKGAAGGAPLPDAGARRDSIATGAGVLSHRGASGSQQRCR